MLRKTAPSSGAFSTASSDVSTSATRNKEDGEKNVKLKRQHQRTQIQNFMMCLGLICAVLLFVMVKFRHSPQLRNNANRYHAQTLRSSKTRTVISRSKDLDFNEAGALAPAAAPPLPNNGNDNQRDYVFIPPKSIYKLSVEDATGQMTSLEKYHGLLAELQSKYQSRGFTVLAFPTNDFHQELATNEEIQKFVSEHFPDVTFPIFGTTSLSTNPVYQNLQQQIPNKHVKHNFYKYLIDKNGIAIDLFEKSQEPMTLTNEIEKLLGPPLHRKVME